MITGASSGLGEEYCRQLAGDCEVIIAVARRVERLESLARELAGRAEVHCIEADLTSDKGVKRAVEAIRQMGPVDILVNNAGFACDGYFAQLSLDEQQGMVDLHINATMTLCHAAIPFMEELGGGTIINVSSIGSFIPQKRISVYTASKAFLNYFSLGLAQEYARFNIKLQSLCPGYTRTEFSETERLAHVDFSKTPEEMWATAQDVVNESLTALDGDKVVVVTGKQNQALVKASLTRLMEQMFD